MVLKSKDHRVWWRRSQVLTSIKLGLVELFNLTLRDKITVKGCSRKDGSLLEIRDSIDQMLGRAGIFCYISWDYPHLATEDKKAIRYIEERLPEWSRTLKRPSKTITSRMRNRDYENCYYG